MTFEEFDRITEITLQEVRAMRDTKGKEYAGTDDRFDNFNRLSEDLEMDRQRIWLVYFIKHLDSIKSYIKHKRTFSSESFHSRVVDAITYLLLIDGMVLESNPSPQICGNNQQNKNLEWNARTQTISWQKPRGDSRDV